MGGAHPKVQRGPTERIKRAGGEGEGGCVRGSVTAAPPRTTAKEQGGCHLPRHVTTGERRRPGQNERDPALTCVTCVLLKNSSNLLGTSSSLVSVVSNNRAV